MENIKFSALAYSQNKEADKAPTELRYTDHWLGAGSGHFTALFLTID